jgi:hypothetical protein
LPVSTPFTTTIEIQISHTQNPTSMRNGVIGISSWLPR